MREKKTVKVHMHLYAEDEAFLRAKRDEFALAALIGGFSAFFTDGSSWVTDGSSWDSYDDVAESCYRVADAMLRERAKALDDRAVASGRARQRAGTRPGARRAGKQKKTTA